MVSGRLLTCAVLLAQVAPAWGETPVPVAAPAGPEVPPAPVDLVAVIMGAHWVVQAVMIVLALAAFAVLTVFLHKSVEMAVANRRLRRADALLRSHPDLTLAAKAAAGLPGAGGESLRIAAAELLAAQDQPALCHGCAERSRLALSRLEQGALRHHRTGVGLLASIAATAPFVGLFGTVFGIMNSFLAISAAKTTSLAVVAPGIAEALFATAIGLVAAIPAVLVHNGCVRALARFRGHLCDVQAMALMAQSRALDSLAGGQNDR